MRTWLGSGLVLGAVALEIGTEANYYVVSSAFTNADSFELAHTLSVWESTANGPVGPEAHAGNPFGVGFQGTVNSGSAPVPEPATIALFGMGLAGLGARRLRTRR